MLNWFNKKDPKEEYKKLVDDHDQQVIELEQLLQKLNLMFEQKNVYYPFGNIEELIRIRKYNMENRKKLIKQSNDIEQEGIEKLKNVGIEIDKIDKEIEGNSKLFEAELEKIKKELSVL